MHTNSSRRTNGYKGYIKSKVAMDQQREKTHQESLRRWQQADLRCKNCGEPIPYGKRRNSFCSQSCAASFNNRGKRHGPPARPRSHKKCLMCDNVLIAHQRKFCSLKCSEECTREKYVMKWERQKRIIASTGEITIQKSASGTRQLTRKYLLDTRLHVCSICDITEWTGQEVPLIADHIDGNPTNNKLTNLRLICPNCDALLDTYTGRNRGSGRKSRGIN